MDKNGPIVTFVSQNSSERSRRPGFLTTHSVLLSQGRNGIWISQPSHPKSLLRSGRRNYRRLCWDAELQCCHCPSQLHTRDPRAKLNPSHYAGTRRLKKRPVGGVAESPLTEPLDPPKWVGDEHRTGGLWEKETRAMGKMINILQSPWTGWRVITSLLAWPFGKTPQKICCCLFFF